MIKIHPVSYLVAAFLFLTLPLNWIAAAMMAGAFHELCHILLLLFLGGRIIKIKILPVGCVIETGILGEWRQVICILAGPVGSFLLIFLCHIIPKIAICGLFQGVFNMIPILPLDGGRLIRLLIYRLCPEQAEKMLFSIAAVVRIIILFISIVLYLKKISGLEPILVAFLWNIKALRRKRPCKQSEIGVQYT